MGLVPCIVYYTNWSDFGTSVKRENWGSHFELLSWHNGPVFFFLGSHPLKKIKTLI